MSDIEIISAGRGSGKNSQMRLAAAQAHLAAFAEQSTFVQQQFHAGYYQDVRASARELAEHLDNFRYALDRYLSPARGV